MRRFYNQHVRTMPRQSLLAMKVAFGVRAQYTAVFMAASLVVFQVIGAIIFAGNASASGPVAVTSLDPVNVTANTARLRARVSTTDTLSWSFELGSTASYGQTHTYSGRPTYENTAIWAFHGLQFSGALDKSAAAVDTSGNVYMSDEAAAKIFKYDPAGNVLLQFGSSGSGNGNFTRVSGLAVAADGSIFISDYYNNRVQKFNSSGAYVAQWGKTGVGDVQAWGPTGLAIDDDGVVYVGSDSGIETFDQNGNHIDHLSTSQPVAGLVVHGTHLYTTYDTVDVYDGSTDHIYHYDLSGTLINSWGKAGYGSTQFSAVYGITTDSEGNVYVPDGGYTPSEVPIGRIKRYTSTGSYIDTVGTSGASPGQFKNPPAIAIDTNDVMYVADVGNSRVQQLTPTIYSNRIVNLTCDATYHHRASVTSGASTYYGTDRTFTMGSCLQDSFTLTPNELHPTARGQNTGWYVYTDPADAATSPITFDVTTGSLPPGLSMSTYSDNGSLTEDDGVFGTNLTSRYSAQIIGTTTQEGTYPFTITATNAGGSISQNYTIEVKEPFIVLPQTLPTPLVGRSYSVQLELQGGWGDANYLADTGNTLPDGLTFDANTGIISGIPTGLGDRNLAPNIYATSNTCSCATSWGPQTVVEVPTVLSSFDLSNGTVGVAYNGPEISSTGEGSPTYEIVGGSLPPGLDLVNPVRIQGTPTTPGTYTFSVKATRGNQSDARQYTVQINTVSPAEFAGGALTSGKVDQNYSTTISGHNLNIYPSSSNYQLVSGALPPGLELDEISGRLSGTPTEEGDFSFRLMAYQDVLLTPVYADFTITIEPADVTPPPGDPQPPEPPVVTPQDPPAPAPVVKTPIKKSSPIKAMQQTASAENSLFALAKQIPVPLAIGLPWLLLLLALILVSSQYYQVHSESQATRQMLASLEHQKQLVEEQNNFVALSTHYLHTPLTVMEGEISLMLRAGTISQAQANTLRASLASINSEAEKVLAQEDQEVSDGSSE